MSLENIKKLYSKNYKAAEISKILNIDYNFCYRNIKKYQALNINLISENTLESKFLRERRGKKKVFINEIQESLKEFLEINDNKFFILKNIKNNFERHYLLRKGISLNFHKNTYHKIITNKKDMNYSYKKTPKYTIYYNNNNSSKTNRKLFSEKYLFYKSIGFKYIFIDEFGISEDIHPSYGWVPKNIKPIPKSLISKKPNLSVICAMTENSLLNYQIFEGGVHGSDFYSFVLSMIKRNKLFDEKWIIIMDNGRCHINKLFKKAETIINFLCLPPYSPQLNPIESLFSLIKKKMFQKFYKSQEDLIRGLKEILNEIEETTYMSYMNSLYKIFKKVLKNEDI